MAVLRWILLTGVVAAAIAFAVALVRRTRMARRESQYHQSRNAFRLQRERLEAKFLAVAAGSGKPRGLRWTDCRFDDDVTYVRDRKSGELSALVAVTISFEAVEGGGMEDVEAVSNLRAGTAVFRCRRDQWSTEGRALFNLNPSEALAYYQGNLVLVAQEPAKAPA